MGYIGLIILGLLLICIPVLLFFSVRWLWSKGRYGRMFLAASFLWVLWSIYDAVYPPQSFYTSELQRLVKVNLPSDAQFQYKTATYPDIHGDYSVCFIVRLSQTSWEQLKTSISSEPVHETKSDGCANMDKKLKPLSLMASQYTLTNRATREDAEILIELIPKENLAVISWYMW
ncbi:hypothetical protein [Methylophilus sp.]|jgi:hypothetical protein|uniref:hypothetical protein n=1 Tax=Methylophilus sp. TaxID=29541 RepID=UPI0011D8719F|nr:hypothetical protein [Methylophilus sp.]TXI47533.1 MAG: hypothetical protein E6Q52_00780 [Methylophilus sp.]